MKPLLKIEALIKTKCDICIIEVQQNMLRKQLKSNKYLFSFGEGCVTSFVKHIIQLLETLHKNYNNKNPSILTEYDEKGSWKAEKC